MDKFQCPKCFAPSLTPRDFLGPIGFCPSCHQWVSAYPELLQRIEQLVEGSQRTGVGSHCDVFDCLEAECPDPKNSEYGFDLFHMMLMNRYSQIHARERVDPDVVESFPVWRWSSLHNERPNARHMKLDGKYFPASVRFVDVRGWTIRDMRDCGCGSTPVCIDDWNLLKSEGAKLERLRKR